MTKFSQTLDLNQSGIVASGHPPVLHNWNIPADLNVKAGQVLAKTAGVVSVWAGATGGGDAPTATSTATSTATVTQDDTTKEVTAVDVDTDVTTTIDGAVGGGTLLAIAISETLSGDTSVPVLVHGCYLFSRVLVADAPISTSQAELLSGVGLYAENTW